jgi:hypothetical protein
VAGCCERGDEPSVFGATKLGNVSSPQCFDFTSFHLVWDCGMPL